MQDYSILVKDYLGFQNIYQVYEKTIKWQIKTFRKKFPRKGFAGPFSQPPFPTLQMSSLGLVPKKDGDYRLIHYLLQCSIKKHKI